MSKKGNSIKIDGKGYMKCTSATGTNLDGLNWWKSVLEKNPKFIMHSVERPDGRFDIYLHYEPESGSVKSKTKILKVRNHDIERFETTPN